MWLRSLFMFCFENSVKSLDFATTYIYNHNFSNFFCLQIVIVNGKGYEVGRLLTAGTFGRLCYLIFSISNSNTIPGILSKVELQIAFWPTIFIISTLTFFHSFLAKHLNILTHNYTLISIQLIRRALLNL